jgi:hypothetical protein
MLSALQMTFEDTLVLKETGFRFFLEGHGENIFDIDLAGTTGWFTNKYPVIFIQRWCQKIEEGNLLNL